MRPCVPGSEEYLDSEKYQTACDRGCALNLNARSSGSTRFVARMRAVSSAWITTFRGFPTIRAGSSSSRNGIRVAETICRFIVNLDPSRAQETVVTVPLAELGLDPDIPYVVEDLLTGARLQLRRVCATMFRPDPNLQPGGAPIQPLAEVGDAALRSLSFFFEASSAADFQPPTGEKSSAYDLLVEYFDLTDSALAESFFFTFRAGFLRASIPGQEVARARVILLRICDTLFQH